MTNYTIPLPHYPIRWPQKGDTLSYRHIDEFYYSFIIYDFNHKTLDMQIGLFQGIDKLAQIKHFVINYDDLRYEQVVALELAITLYGR